MAQARGLVNKLWVIRIRPKSDWPYNQMKMYRIKADLWLKTPSYKVAHDSVVNTVFTIV